MKFQMNITTSYDDVCRFFSADDLKSFYKSHGCDGLEVMPLDNYDPADLEHPIPPEECSLIRSSMVRGVHCCCLGDWMDKDREELIRHYPEGSGLCEMDGSRVCGFSCGAGQ